MSHMRGSRKQKRSLNSHDLLARYISFRSSLGGIRSFTLRPRILAVGLAATIGLSSLAIATAQYNAQVKANITTNSEPDSDSTDVQNASTADITVDAFSNDTPASESTSAPDPGAQTQVTINDETIPVTNGTVHRTITGSDGSLDVDVSVNSNSSNGSNGSSTRLDIDAGSSTRVNLRSSSQSRGSPGN